MGRGQGESLQSPKCTLSTSKIQSYYLIKDQGRVHLFGTYVRLGIRHERGEELWIGDLLIVDTEDLQTIPRSEIVVKKIQIKRSDAGRCEILQEGQPSSAAVYKAGGDLMR